MLAGLSCTLVVPALGEATEVILMWPVHTAASHHALYPVQTF